MNHILFFHQQGHWSFVPTTIKEKTNKNVFLINTEAAKIFQNVMLYDYMCRVLRKTQVEEHPSADTN